MKAIGTGWRRGVAWRDFETVETEHGLGLEIHGRALELVARARLRARLGGRLLHAHARVRAGRARGRRETDGAVKPLGAGRGGGGGDRARWSSRRARRWCWRSSGRDPGASAQGELAAGGTVRARAHRARPVRHSARRRREPGRRVPRARLRARAGPPLADGGAAAQRARAAGRARRAARARLATGSRARSASAPPPTARRRSSRATRAPRSTPTPRA